MDGTRTVRSRVPAGILRRTVPRQHGAWAVLLVSFAIGTAAAGTVTPASFVLLLGGLAAFFARETLQQLLRETGEARRRLLLLFVGHGTIGLGAVGLLAGSLGLPAFLPVAVIVTGLFLFLASVIFGLTA